MDHQYQNWYWCFSNINFIPLFYDSFSIDPQWGFVITMKLDFYIFLHNPNLRDVNSSGFWIWICWGGKREREGSGAKEVVRHCITAFCTETEKYKQRGQSESVYFISSCTTTRSGLVIDWIKLFQCCYRLITITLTVCLFMRGYMMEVYVVCCFNWIKSSRNPGRRQQTLSVMLAAAIVLSSASVKLHNLSLCPFCSWTLPNMCQLVLSSCIKMLIFFHISMEFTLGLWQLMKSGSPLAWEFAIRVIAFPFQASEAARSG